MAAKKTARKKRARTSRSAGMTQISISIPERIVDQVDKMAKEENRNRSNFIANCLKQLTEG